MKEVDVTDIEDIKEVDITDIKEEQEPDVKNKSADKDDSIESEGDANIELASGSYNEGLAGQGLLMLSESEGGYDLQMQVEDVSDANGDENEKEKSQKQDGNENSNVKKYEYVKSGDVCNLDEIAEEVESMMLQQDSVEKSEKRKTRLELILKLLQEEADEQSINKTEPTGTDIDGGGSMPICKMSATEENKPPDGSPLEKPKSDEHKLCKPTGGGSMPIYNMSVTEDNKPPDGSSLEKPKSDEHKSHKPAGGGGMPIHKMSVTEENKPDGSSPKPAGGGSMPICKMSATEDNKPPDGSGGGGTESIPQKPALHHQLTGLFSLRSQISADKENPGDRSQIHKIVEAKSENPAEGVGKSKETEPKLPTTPQKSFNY